MVANFLNILVCVLNIPVFLLDKLKLKEEIDSLRMLNTCSSQRGV